MNRLIKKIVLSMTLLPMLTSCGKPCDNPTDLNHDGICDYCGEKGLTIIHSDLNHDGICDGCGDRVTVKHIDRDENNFCDVCGRDLRGPIDVRRKLNTDEWDQDLKDMLAFALTKEGEALTFEVEAPNGYYVYFEEIETYEGSHEYITCAFINVLGVNDSTIEREFEALALQNGFYFGSSAYVYKYVNATTDLIIQYSVHQGVTYNYLELQFYVAETRQANWPSEALDYFLGIEVPHYECESYESSFNVYTYEFQIFAHDVSLTAMQDYGTTLIANGYTKTANTSESDKYLSSDGMIEITVYPASDEYLRDSLIIRINYKWPFIEINATLGCNIPKYSSNFEAEFMDMNNNGIADYFGIYYLGTSLSDFVAIYTQFIQDGWTILEEDSTETYKVLQKTVDEELKEVEIVYSASRQETVVAIGFEEVA